MISIPTPRHTRRSVGAVLALSLAVGAGPALAAKGPTAPGTTPSKRREPCVAFAKTSPGTGGFGAIQICVTKDGNVQSYGIGGSRWIQDGYRLCYRDNGVPVLVGADLGPGTGQGFGPSTTDQPNGAGTFPLTITRWTDSPLIAFTQVFELGEGDDVDLHVTMSADYFGGAGAIDDVTIVRQFDRERPKTKSSPQYTKWQIQMNAKQKGLVSDTADSALGWTEGKRYGLMLTSPHLGGAVSLLPGEPTWATGVVKGGHGLQTIATACEGFSQFHLLGPGDGQGKAVFSLGWLTAQTNGLSLFVNKDVRFQYRLF